MQLKEATGLSWNEISDRCRVPVSTIRSYASGSVAQPSHQALHDIVTALGGSLDDLYATPASVRSDLLKVREIEAEADEDLKITIRTMREIREEMLQSVRDSYERQISKAEEAYTREIAHLNDTHQREIAALSKSNRTLRTTVLVAVAALLVTLLVVIGILSYDITHLDKGWVQAAFPVGSIRYSDPSGFCGIIDWFKGVVC